MGLVAKSATGARAKLYINGQLSGIFGSVDYSVAYSVEPIYVLGRYNAAELVYTSMGTVGVNASGFRVVGNGPHVISSVPKLQDLLNHQDISLAIVDRQTGTVILTVNGVRPAGYSADSSSRGLHNLNVNFVGITVQDESGPQTDAGAVNFG